MKNRLAAILFALSIAGTQAQTFSGTKTPVFGGDNSGNVGLRIGVNTYRPIGNLDPNTQAWRPQLQPPTTSILGGVLAVSALSHQFITGVGTDGVLTKSQPSFGDLAGSATAAQMPAFTGGDCSTSAGSVSISCSAFGRLAGANTWTLAQTFSVPPIYSSLTGYLYANGAGALTASATIPATALSGTIDCLREPNQTGDITSPAGSCNFTINNGAVTSAKMASGAAYGNLDPNSVDAGKMFQAPAGTIRGNRTVGTANVADSTLSDHMAAAFGTVRGTAIVYGATGYVPRVPTVAGQALTFDGTDTNFASPGAATTLFPGLLSGLTTANNGVSALDIQAGTAASDDATVRMTLSSTLTKTLAAWSAGSGNGGLDTGTAAANTWYAVYSIYNPTTLATDGLFSLSTSAPTLPSGYTKKRRIGAIRTTGTATNITGFVQLGDLFTWTAAVLEVNAATPTSGNQNTVTLTVPPGISVIAQITAAATYGGSGAPSYLYVYPTIATARPSLAAVTGSVSGNTAESFVSVLTNTASQILTSLTYASGNYSLQTNGWIDTRGK